MTAKIITFSGITRLDLPPERVIDMAKEVDLEGVVIMEFRKDGGAEYFASSYADGGTVLWLMERCKARLLTVEVP